MLKHLLQCLESLQTESKCNWFYRNCLANDGNTSTLSGFSNFSTRSSLKQNWKMTLQSREILIVALKLSIQVCFKSSSALQIFQCFTEKLCNLCLAVIFKYISDRWRSTLNFCDYFATVTLVCKKIGKGQCHLSSYP